MKGYYLILILVAIIISSCNECRNNDCGEDDFISIQVENDHEVIYTYDIDFYYYDENQQKIEADIERARYSSNTFYALLVID